MKKLNILKTYHDSMVALSVKTLDRSRAGRNFRVMLLVIGVAILAFQVHVIIKIQNNVRIVPELSVATEAQVEVAAVTEKIPAIDVYVAKTKITTQTVALIRGIDRQPFGIVRETVMNEPTDPLPPTGSGVGEFVYEPEAPVITVKGFMILGSQSAVVADIEGEGEGIILKEGSKFSGGNGVIEKIDQAGISYLWRGKTTMLSMGEL